MIRFFFIIILLINLGNQLWAQTIDPNNKNKTKEWSEGNLTWEDFIENKELDKPSELYYDLEVTLDARNINKIKVKRTKVLAVIYRDSSIVNPQHKTAEQLQYNQIIFNIVELYRRRLQNQLDYIYSLTDGIKALEEAKKDCAEEIAEFKAQCAYGLSTSLKKWEEYINSQLSLQKDEINLMPIYRERNFSWDFSIGGGYGLFSPSLNQQFNSPSLFVSDINFFYQKVFLGFMVSVSQFAARSESTFAVEYPQDMKYVNFHTGLNTGFILYNSPNFKLSPFGGIGFNKFRLEDMKFLKQSFSPLLGVNVDFKFYKELFLSPNFFETKRYNEISVRTRFYLSQLNYSNGLRGYFFNLGLGINIFDTGIRTFNQDDLHIPSRNKMQKHFISSHFGKPLLGIANFQYEYVWDNISFTSYSEYLVHKTKLNIYDSPLFFTKFGLSWYLFGDNEFVNLNVGAIGNRLEPTIGLELGYKLMFDKSFFGMTKYTVDYTSVRRDLLSEYVVMFGYSF
jgi:hypothetical protein